MSVSTHGWERMERKGKGKKGKKERREFSLIPHPVTNRSKKLLLFPVQWFFFSQSNVMRELSIFVTCTTMTSSAYPETALAVVTTPYLLINPKRRLLALLGYIPSPPQLSVQLLSSRKYLHSCFSLAVTPRGLLDSRALLCLPSL